LGQIEVKGSDLDRPEQFWRFVEVLGEYRDVLEVGTLRMPREAAKLHVLGHALAKRGPRSFSLGCRRSTSRCDTATWRLGIWHDLPHCVAAARGAPDSSMNLAIFRLVQQTGNLHNQAKEAGAAVGAVEASEVFELVTAL
jgi:hypothetical protein